MNPSITNILTRHSVREFTGQVISKDTLLSLIRAGMAAPSAVDKRPWEFFVITEIEQLQGLRDNPPFAKMIVQVGASLVVVGRLDSQWGGPDSTYGIADCSAATQKILPIGYPKVQGRAKDKWQEEKIHWNRWQ